MSLTKTLPSLLTTCHHLRSCEILIKIRVEGGAEIFLPMLCTVIAIIHFVSLQLTYTDVCITDRK
jgi:hypothetical protein